MCWSPDGDHHPPPPQIFDSATFISCSRILPCGTDFLLLLRCDWAYARQSNVFGQVTSFFNVTNWLSPLKLRKICHLTKFSDTYFAENQQNSPIHKTTASTIKTPLSLRMQRNLKWKSREWDSIFSHRKEKNYWNKFRFRVKRKLWQSHFFFSLLLNFTLINVYICTVIK